MERQEDSQTDRKSDRLVDIDFGIVMKEKKTHIQEVR